MLSIIVAIANDNVIGKDNKLIWHISDDLKRFKEITNGHKIVMGRKTFESLPGVLPNREHIIITRDTNYSIDSNRVGINNINSIINDYRNSNEEIFIIGGAEIYKQFLPYADKLYLTKINASFDGDTFFPTIEYENFNVDYESQEFLDSKSNLVYKFINLTRK